MAEQDKKPRNQQIAEPATAAQSALLEQQQWRIDSHPANLREIRLELEAFAKKAGLPEKSSDAIGLAANEALANVIRHGYSGLADKPIVVTAENRAGEFRVLIRDWGRKFDPASLPADKVDPLEPGGLGLICMRQLMDEVKFVPQPDGTLLVMVKKLGGES